MRRRVFKCLSALACVWLCGVNRAAGDVLFSNFGPGMAFNPSIGIIIVGVPTPLGTFQSVAEQFTPVATAFFKSAELPLYLNAGPGVTVLLQADSNGVPGRILEQLYVTAVPPTPTVITVRSFLRPQLRGGTPYWLTVVGPGALAGWNLNSIGDNGTGTNHIFSTGDTPEGPWFESLGVRPAFQINGRPPTPQEALELIEDDVALLLRAGGLAPGPANALTVRLELAFARLDRGDTSAACDELNAFVNQVRTYAKLRIIFTVYAQALVEAAEAIQSQICN